MKVSIITATWNSGATLRDTLESVLSQSYQDFEHIIIDGLSNDNTLDIIREFAPRYSGKLRWISEKDKGIYDAINKGIAMASGDVIGILNSDDFFTNNDVLAKVAEYMDDDDSIDAVYGDIHFVRSSNLDRRVRYYSSRNFSRWQMLFGVQPAHPSFYCRKKVYDSHGKYDIALKIAADFEYLLRVIYIHKISIKYIPLDFVTMRTGGASTKGLKSHARILRDHYRAYRKHHMVMAQLMDVFRYPIKLMRFMQR